MDAVICHSRGDAALDISLSGRGSTRGKKGRVVHCVQGGYTPLKRLFSCKL